MNRTAPLIRPWRRALASALAPGMGQLLNRQAVKGAALVAGAGLWLVAFLAVSVLKISSAYETLNPLHQGPNVQAAMYGQLRAQGYAWFIVLLSAYAAMAGYAAWDAWRQARRLAEPLGRDQKSCVL